MRKRLNINILNPEIVAKFLSEKSLQSEKIKFQFLNFSQPFALYSVCFIDGPLIHF